MAGIHVKFEVTPETFLSRLTEAAYHIALKYGFQASFVDVELDLRAALRQIIDEDMRASTACGSADCLAFKTDSLAPWSKEAKKLFGEE